MTHHGSMLFGHDLESWEASLFAGEGRDDIVRQAIDEVARRHLPAGESIFLSVTPTGSFPNAVWVMSFYGPTLP